MKYNLKDLEAKSDQMNAVDFVRPMIFRIERIVYNERQEQGLHLHLEGYNGRPFKPCKGMRRGLVGAWGDELDNWVGCLLNLYCEPSVTWGAQDVGGIRISAISNIAEPYVFPVQLSKTKRVMWTFDVIPDEHHVVKEFIATHHEDAINEAESNEAITAILATVKAEFGADAMNQLKDTAIAARAKFAEKPTDEQPTTEQE